MDSIAEIGNLDLAVRRSLNFYLGHAIVLLPYVRRTAYRKIREGSLQTRQLPDRRHLISLSEINNQRKEYNMPEISEEEAIAFWERW